MSYRLKYQLQKYKKKVKGMERYFVVIYISGGTVLVCPARVEIMTEIFPV